MGADAYLVDAALGDWIAAEPTSGRITGTWGYHQIADRMARMATVLRRTADAAEYRALASRTRDAFHDAIYHEELGRYTSGGNGSTAGATQAAQALALDEGLVPEGERGRVLDSLVELVEGAQLFGGGPHFGAGAIGLAPTVRALMGGGRDDVLWRVVPEDTRPSYGYFMASTTANPRGLTTLPEQWDMGNSKHRHFGSSPLSQMPFAGVFLLHDASQHLVAMDAIDTQVEEHLSQLGTPILGHFTYDPALMPVNPHYPGVGATTVLDPIATGQSEASTSAATNLARRLWPDEAQDAPKTAVPTPNTQRKRRRRAHELAHVVTRP